MIRTITVSTGEGPYARAAQEHAIDLAKRCRARLRIVALWDGKDAAAGADAQAFVEQNGEEVAEKARAADVNVVESLRGDGMTRGLLEEARETDLLVLGLPTEADEEDDDTARHLVGVELPVLRKAECSLLTVSRNPTQLKKIFARYRAGVAGKAMLRSAGFLAERAGATLGVFTLEHDLARATELAETAREYLAGFDIPHVETLSDSGASDSELEILEAAQSFEADLIAMGEEGHTWLERLLGINLAERTALRTSTPLLIGR